MALSFWQQARQIQFYTNKLSLCLGIEYLCLETSYFYNCFFSITSRRISSMPILTSLRPTPSSALQPHITRSPCCPVAISKCTTTSTSIRYCTSLQLTYTLEIGQDPRSRFCGTASIEMSKSNMSIGIPSVVQTFGTSTIPAIEPLIGAHDKRRQICSPEYPVRSQLAI